MQKWFNIERNSTPIVKIFQCGCGGSGIFDETGISLLYELRKRQEYYTPAVPVSTSDNAGILAAS
jgi:hypothetical protein